MLHAYDHRRKNGAIIELGSYKSLAIFDQNERCTNDVACIPSGLFKVVLGKMYFLSSFKHIARSLVCLRTRRTPPENPSSQVGRTITVVHTIRTTYGAKSSGALKRLYEGGTKCVPKIIGVRDHSCAIHTKIVVRALIQTSYE